MAGYVGKITAEYEEGPVAASAMGTCSTPSATAAKIVTFEAFTNLMDGVSIRVLFRYSNTAANPTLDVNGTGPLPIYRYGTTAPGQSAKTSWQAGAVISLTYVSEAGENGAWMIDNWENDDTTYNVATQNADGLMSAQDKTNLDALNSAKAGYDTLVKPKIFQNVSVASNLWVSSSTYANYPYQADISGLTGVDATYLPIVAFNPNNHASYNFAGVALSQAGGKLRIYAAIKPTTNITIPSIAFIK